MQGRKFAECFDAGLKHLMLISTSNTSRVDSDWKWELPNQGICDIFDVIVSTAVI